MKQKLRLFIIIGVEFLVIALILVLVFFAGKRSYTVTFDLDGGTLISGDLIQEVTQGGNATPPKAGKDGCYFHSWSASYNQITRNMTIRAIWEYETTVGIQYKTFEDANYCLIESVFPDLHGEVYVGAFHDGKRVLGVMEGAFENCKDITKIYMLNGIISIEKNAFAGCTSLESIVLPGTLVNLRDGAFKNCTSLKDVTMSPSLKNIGVSAFENCTSLEKIDLPEGLTHMSNGSFAGCTSLTDVIIPSTVEVMGDCVFNSPSNRIHVYCAQPDKPDTWSDFMALDGAKIDWGYKPPEIETGIEDTEKKG